MNSTVAIINPNSALGRTGTHLSHLTDQLRRHIGDFELLQTSGIGNAIDLAQHSAEAGAEKLIVLGGDGTASEVVTGLLRSGRAHEVQLGLVPLGTGGDFKKTAWKKRDLESAFRRLTSGKTRSVDAAEYTYMDPNGNKQTRAYLNILSCGLSGFAALWIERQAIQGKRGRLTYIRSGLYGIRHYPQHPVRIEVDSQLVHHGPLVFTAIANGQYFGGGMKVAPNAVIDDGQLDVVIIPASSKLQLLFRFPKIRTGKHLDLADVKSVRGKRVSIQGDVWLEADGEPAGTAPIDINVVPEAIQLCDE